MIALDEDTRGAVAHLLGLLMAETSEQAMQVRQLRKSIIDTGLPPPEFNPEITRSVLQTIVNAKGANGRLALTVAQLEPLLDALENFK